ncbi:hypothetical protein CO656_05355 [Sinorhizobium sp. FG01]|uniref:Uncharacterized protein n=2 Tax=Sinorhizobium TaxID=28105 RepID=A0A2S3YQ12_9HYPH|nr:hypothetical protein NXT3_CH02297 [Sinorhizobium fredii]PDT43056.1 hypothetical protein CO656_05355 [Sinorhizobium sp. FG01]POH32969.1 hypothetical protein ATY31_13950 [Sinorhizobium americanum]
MLQRGGTGRDTGSEYGLNKGPAVERLAQRLTRGLGEATRRFDSEGRKGRHAHRISSFGKDFS